MGSDPLAIFNAIRGINVQYGTPPVTPTMPAIDEIPDLINTANLPVRLTLPVWDVEGDQIHPVALGRTWEVTWTVNDVLFVLGATQGLGLGDQLSDMLNYCGDYIDGIKALNGGASWWFANWSIKPQVIEYPPESETWWKAVVAKVMINERV